MWRNKRCKHTQLGRFNAWAYNFYFIFHFHYYYSNKKSSDKKVDSFMMFIMLIRYYKRKCVVAKSAASINFVTLWVSSCWGGFIFLFFLFYYSIESFSLCFISQLTQYWAVLATLVSHITHTSKPTKTHSLSLTHIYTFMYEAHLPHSWVAWWVEISIVCKYVYMNCPFTLICMCVCVHVCVLFCLWCNVCMRTVDQILFWFLDKVALCGWCF